MIVDAFIFNNEKDILKARLNYLNNHVDYFVIVESNNTFTGINKKLILKDFIKKNFKHLEHKILIFENKIKISCKSDLLFKNNKILKENSPSLNRVLKMGDQATSKKEIALNETYQRELIKIAINKFIKNKNAIIIVSDLDEIPKVNFVKKLNSLKEDQIYYADMKQFVHSTNFQLMEKWIGCVGFRKSLINKYSIYYFRFMLKHQNNYLIPYKVIPNAGWHLTSFGSIEMIKRKLSSWGHWELNTILNRIFLSYRIKRGFDIFGRNKKILYIAKNSDLPKSISKIFSNKKYSKEFIKPTFFDLIFNKILTNIDKLIKLISLILNRF
tara:strand:+ start:12466 stop:13446 length:981 start_codon:yes stop_codon:yes gene_type:complete